LADFVAETHQRLEDMHDESTGQSDHISEFSDGL
jgi:hypothetical protein